MSEVPLLFEHCNMRAPPRRPTVHAAYMKVQSVQGYLVHKVRLERGTLLTRCI